MNLPLFGKTIVVTRAAGQSSQFSYSLQNYGAKVIEMPTIEIVPPSSWDQLDQAITSLSDFDWLILTSTNAVDYFFERLASQLKDLRGLAAIKIAVVGEKTAQRLRQRGLQPDFIPPEYIADAMVVNFPESIDGKKILFPRVETGGRDVLVRAFSDRGAIITEVAAYQSTCPRIPDAKSIAVIQDQAANLVTFASSKTVKHFCELLQQTIGDHWVESLKIVKFASIGPQTSKTCRALLGRVEIEAEEFTLDGLIKAIVAQSSLL
ncbi:uroporphyrinogen-III synthase [Leptolyngbya sp. FACHB-17]|uniref:uroporphyrinogen-III synthase n=1 Tax=unclassified Leptolyngbya TaxID=2650499 RepID=UPI0016804F9E|nr:uroporphyrinogen-III synthase [Leptolyngbya sp. FACHB-17]MBD2083273.1 uroporphyrinogen-III synthase [Leptolyngbya sp. FACHB-17]